MVDYIGAPRFERRWINSSAAQPLAGVYGLTLIKQDGTVIDLEKLGYTVTSFIDNGFSMDWINEELDDLDGTVDLGSSLSPRSLSITVVFTSYSRQMDALKVAQLRDIFSNRNLFTLRTVPESEKEIIVRRTGQLNIGAPVGNYLREATISLSAPSPYWQSIQPAFQPLEIGKGWAAGVVDLAHAQTDRMLAGVTEQTFWNEGGADIDPRSIHTPLKIVVRGGVSTAEPFILENKTTGTSVKLEGLSNAQARGNITFDGVRVYTGVDASTGTSLFSKSARTVLTLAAGENKLAITSGALAATNVQLVTRYYYN